MITGKTETGFEFQFDPIVMDNMELLEAAAECDTNPVAISKVLRMVLDDDQRKGLYEHLRTEDGRVPVTSVSNAVMDIFKAYGKRGKN